MSVPTVSNPGARRTAVQAFSKPVDRRQLLVPSGNSRTVILYHYTDSSAKESILEDGYIRASYGYDGTGVYLTTMSPRRHTEEDIARNNFRAGWRSRMRYGRVRYAFQFSFLQGRVEQCLSDQYRNRDVWIYKTAAKGLYLTKYGTGKLYERDRGTVHRVSIQGNTKKSAPVPLLGSANTRRQLLHKDYPRGARAKPNPVVARRKTVPPTIPRPDATPVINHESLSSYQDSPPNPSQDIQDNPPRSLDGADLFLPDAGTSTIHHESASFSNQESPLNPSQDIQNSRPSPRDGANLVAPDAGTSTILHESAALSNQNNPSNPSQDIQNSRRRLLDRADPDAGTSTILHEKASFNQDRPPNPSHDIQKIRLDRAEPFLLNFFPHSWVGMSTLFVALIAIYWFVS